MQRQCETFNHQRCKTSNHAYYLTLDHINVSVTLSNYSLFHRLNQVLYFTVWSQHANGETI